MFTGLIETICTVTSISRLGGTTAARLTVDLGQLAEEAKIGGSIAVNGACLTVAELNANLAVFELSSETLTKSTLRDLKPASNVNIERPVKADGRFDGHFVTGHIDGTAAIKTIDKQGNFANIKFTAGPELLDQMILKGSVAVDGISLTIADLDKDSFSIAVIPQTLEKTTLGKAKTGDTVNIETDIIVKTIKKQLESALGGPQQQKLTIEKLKELGF